MAKRICRTCMTPKENSEFNKCSTHLGGDGLTRHCKECIDKRRALRVAQSAAPEPEAEVDWSKFTGPKILSTPSIGYAAQVHEGDVVIWQDSEQGEKAIWLTRAEASQLAHWIRNLEDPGMETVHSPLGTVGDHT